jgi:hypothetical protein
VKWAIFALEWIWGKEVNGMKMHLVVGLLSLLLMPGWGALVSAQIAETSTGGSSVPLKGGIKGSVLLFEDGLVKMGEAVEELKTATTMVMGEVTRKQTQFVRGPNVIGPGIIIPALGGPSGTIPFGDLPARKKQLDRFVNSTSYFVELLQNEVNALMLPDEPSAEFTAAWNSVRFIMDEMQLHLVKLKDLAVGPKYDNAKIGKEALAILDKAKTVNSLRRKILAMLKSEPLQN